MLALPCPHCGPRGADEFAYHGELVPRPDPIDTSPTAWRSYLYLRENRAGQQTERWFHRDGCRRFLLVTRDTVTNRVEAAWDEASQASGDLPGELAG